MVPSLDVCQTFCVDRFVDGDLSQHTSALVDDGGLTGGNALNAVVQFDFPHYGFGAIDVAGRHASTAGDRFGVSTHLDVAVEPLTGSFFSDRSTGPGWADTGNAVDSEHLARSHHNGVIFRTNFQHEASLAVISGFTDGQAAALTDGEGLRARVGAYLLTSVSRIGPSSMSIFSSNQPRVSPSGMKQMSWESGF